jgi:hypothetical protein
MFAVIDVQAGELRLCDGVRSSIELLFEAVLKISSITEHYTTT